LVDDDEGLVVAFADLSLELDDLLASLVGELSFGGGELFSLFGGGVEEGGVDFGLFVLEGDVAGQNVAVLESSGHVGVSGTVIEDKTSDKSGLGGKFMGHVHHLDHEEIDGLAFSSDDFDGIDDDIDKSI
jgi:hypothetical protein